MSAVQTIQTSLPTPRRRVVCSAATASAIRRWKSEIGEDRIAVISPHPWDECPICGEEAYTVLRVVDEGGQIVNFKDYENPPIWCPKCKMFAWEYFPRIYGGWRNGADYKCARVVRVSDCPPITPASRWGEIEVWEDPEER